MLRIKNFVDALKNPNKIRFFTKSSVEKQLAKPNLRVRPKDENIGALGWFLLLVPASTFGLGTWQVERKKWKENLITDLQCRSSSQPVPLPEDLGELRDLEYYPVYVKGHFIHDKELYMGPRSLLTDGDASTQGGLMSKNQKQNTGYLVVTPFKLADRDLTILVNRGWVSTKNKDPRSRTQGQISGETELVGIVRLKESRPNFIPNNNPEANSWFYRDLDTMARCTDAVPIFLDTVSHFDVPGGPIGGQTRVTLRNEHLSYIITWYSLCGFTSLMWFRQFIQKLPLL